MDGTFRRVARPDGKRTMRAYAWHQWLHDLLCEYVGDHGLRCAGIVLKKVLGTGWNIYDDECEMEKVT